MTTCKASADPSPTCPDTWPLRLRTVRIALEAKQEELALLWELSSRQIVSHWERGRTPIPDEMLPKIEELERLAAAGGKLDDARAEIARLKDRQLAAQIERVHQTATRWQAMGTRPVPLIEGGTPAQQAELDLLAAPIVRPVPPPANAPANPPQSADFAERAASSPPPAADPYTTQIDWEGFVVEVDGVRGISLRELVERGGLYSKIEGAVRALLRSGLDFYSSEVKVAMGRPRKEYLFRDVNDAIEFCIIAASPTAHQIRRLLMAHHLEFQRLIAGDAQAQQRLADAQAVHSRIEQQAAADPLLGSLLALAEVRTRQLDHDARLKALEERERIRIEESERMLARLKGAGLPAPTVEAPALSERKALVAQMARVGMDAGNTQDHHHAAWRHLYAQYEHRAGVDLKTRAKNAGIKPLDYAEAHGHVAALYALALELWPALGDAQA